MRNDQAADGRCKTLFKALSESRAVPRNSGTLRTEQESGLDGIIHIELGHGADRGGVDSGGLEHFGLENDGRRDPRNQTASRSGEILHHVLLLLLQQPLIFFVWMVSRRRTLEEHHQLVVWKLSSKNKRIRRSHSVWMSESEEKLVAKEHKQENEPTQSKGGSKKSRRKKKVYNETSTLPEEEFVDYCQKILSKTQVKDDSLAQDLLALPEAFKHYSFTGTLRPCFVFPQVQVPPFIAKPDYADTGIPISEQEDDRRATIHVYSPEEIGKVRHACAIGREVLDIAARFCKAGVTGDEINRIVHEACIERNAYPSPLNYYNFPKSVCVSVNEVICHGIPDARPLKDGDIVNIDVSVYVDGVHADLNEMFFIGEVDEEGVNLVKTAFKVLQASCEMIKPGTFYRDVGMQISKIANSNGCAVVKKYSGHGTGRLFHCAPTVPHYANNKAVGIMRAGHIFTIEPMLNVGKNWRDVLWPDDWTAATVDGNRSAQFEHTFLVTETGVEILTARPGTSRKEMVWNEEMENHLQRPGSAQ